MDPHGELLKEVVGERARVTVDGHIAVEFGQALLAHLSPVLAKVLLAQEKLQTTHMLPFQFPFQLLIMSNFVG